VTRAPTDRAHLSIGEVLSLLQGEFPDVTISKIRFLESQGLLDPERTPSGYRKFYDDDIERLRWILHQQKNHYLPLKVIKDRLDGAGSPPTNPAPSEGTGRAPGLFDSTATGGQPSAAAVGVHSPTPTGVAVDERPDLASPRPGGNRPASHGTDRSAAPPPAAVTAPVAADPVRPAPATKARARADRIPDAPPVPEDSRATLQQAGAPPSAARPEARPTPQGRHPLAAAQVAPSTASLSLTVDELAEAAGLSVRAVRELEDFGLVESFAVGDATYYDGDDLVMARTAAGLLAHGIEPRHMRTYRVAVDREAGLFEQIVLPLLKQRNPDARKRATETIVELIKLGETMRDTLLRRELRDHLPPH
jgi:DNA-binding transcriptional MerR regulator